MLSDNHPSPATTSPRCRPANGICHVGDWSHAGASVPIAMETAIWRAGHRRLRRLQVFLWAQESPHLVATVGSVDVLQTLLPDFDPRGERLVDAVVPVNGVHAGSIRAVAPLVAASADSKGRLCAVWNASRSEVEF